MAENPAALSQAVQRALTEALGSIQRQLAEVQGSFEQVKKALEAAAGEGSTDRTVALLPPLMHMQAAGAALAASIETVLRFVGASAQWTGIPAAGMPVAAPGPAAARRAPVKHSLKKLREASTIGNAWGCGSCPSTSLGALFCAGAQKSGGGGSRTRVRKASPPGVYRR